jgi:hypothetical protein
MTKRGDYQYKVNLTANGSLEIKSINLSTSSVYTHIVKMEDIKGFRLIESIEMLKNIFNDALQQASESLVFEYNTSTDEINVSLEIKFTYFTEKLKFTLINIKKSYNEYTSDFITGIYLKKAFPDIPKRDNGDLALYNLIQKTSTFMKANLLPNEKIIFISHQRERTSEGNYPFANDVIVICTDLSNVYYDMTITNLRENKISQKNNPIYLKHSKPMSIECIKVIQSLMGQFDEDQYRNKQVYELKPLRHQILFNVISKFILFETEILQNQVPSIDLLPPPPPEFIIGDAYVLNEKQKNECCVCFNSTERKKACVPCGHTLYCNSCISNLKNCSLCNQEISLVIDLY